jgi:3-phosphoshikimate 1-carboxyvinyltransferase
MNITLSPSTPRGALNAVSSKSAAHRILICSAFADKSTVIRCEHTNRDIEATADCLRALGARIEYRTPYFYVTPISTPTDGAVLNCAESGSTLRFLLPIIPALGISARFSMLGRLPERPLSPLYEELISHGACLSAQGSNPLLCEGELGGGEYRIRGDVSSQFISGLLFALTVSGKGGEIIIEGKTESAPYIEMTESALAIFGAPPRKNGNGYTVLPNSRLISPEAIDVEGDWSGAAFPLCMGAIGKGEVTLRGLRADSRQGDMQIIGLLHRFGADISEKNGEYAVRGGAPLRGIDIDATQIPDLVPVLAVVASVASGTTNIRGVSRLRLKESDRVASVCAMLTALGADVSADDDSIAVRGRSGLAGGTVNTFNDHRIAMSAAVASVVCEGEVCVLDAQCVSKSYPRFWEDISEGLGVHIKK